METAVKEGRDEGSQDKKGNEPYPHPVCTDFVLPWLNFVRASDNSNQANCEVCCDTG